MPFLLRWTMAATLLHNSFECLPRPSPDRVRGPVTSLVRNMGRNARVGRAHCRPVAKIPSLQLFYRDPCHDLPIGAGWVARAAFRGRRAGQSRQVRPELVQGEAWFPFSSLFSACRIRVAARPPAARASTLARRAREHAPCDHDRDGARTGRPCARRGAASFMGRVAAPERQLPGPDPCERPRRDTGVQVETCVGVGAGVRPLR